MKYKYNNKTYNIPDEEIAKSCKNLDLTQEEAIQMWLEDNEIEENEEQTALDNKASEVKLKLGARADAPKKKSAPKPKSVSEEKKQVFSLVKDVLLANFGENVEIANENKLIFVKIDGKCIKIDFVDTKKH